MLSRLVRLPLYVPEPDRFLSLGAIWTQAGIAFLDAHIRRSEKYRFYFHAPVALYH